MNLDKKLANYAKHLNNPKYYGKILAILNKADKTNYQFTMFNLHDLEKITGDICSYYEVIQTPEENKRMIKHCNTNWFLISDKKYILFETESFFIAINVYIRMYIMLHFSKLSHISNPKRFYTAENVEKDIFIVRGAIKAANFLEANFFDLDEYYVR